MDERRIRMVKGVAGQWRYYALNEVLTVPGQIDEALADKYVKCGLAIEDKIAQEPAETKAEPAPEPAKTRKSRRAKEA